MPEVSEIATKGDYFDFDAPIDREGQKTTRLEEMIEELTTIAKNTWPRFDALETKLQQKKAIECILASICNQHILKFDISVKPQAIDTIKRLTFKKLERKRTWSIKRSGSLINISLLKQGEEDFFIISKFSEYQINTIIRSEDMKCFFQRICPERNGLQVTVLKEISEAFLAKHKVTKVDEDAKMIFFSIDYPTAFSKLNRGTPISEFHWGVTLIAYQGAISESNEGRIKISNPGHAAIIIEGLEVKEETAPQAVYKAQIAHLVVQNDRGENSAYGIFKLETKDRLIGLDTTRVNYTPEMHKTDLEGIFPLLSKTRTWIRSKKEVEDMLTLVESFKKFQNNSHMINLRRWPLGAFVHSMNCTSWALRVLKSANIEVQWKAESYISIYRPYSYATEKTKTWNFRDEALEALDLEKSNSSLNDRLSSIKSSLDSVVGKCIFKYLLDASRDVLFRPLRGDKAKPFVPELEAQAFLKRLEDSQRDSTPSKTSRVVCLWLELLSLNAHDKNPLLIMEYERGNARTPDDESTIINRLKTLITSEFKSCVKQKVEETISSLDLDLLYLIERNKTYRSLIEDMMNEFFEKSLLFPFIYVKLRTKVDNVDFISSIIKLKLLCIIFIAQLNIRQYDLVMQKKW